MDAVRLLSLLVSENRGDASLGGAQSQVAADDGQVDAIGFLLRKFRIGLGLHTVGRSYH